MAKKQKTIQFEQATIDAVQKLADVKGWSFQSTAEKAINKGLRLVK